MQNSPTRSGIDVGSVLDETYTIEALIGAGGMGSVFLASHRRLAGKKVAIKMLHAGIGGDEMLARFKREADIASTLDHPNIVKVENYNVLPDGTPYIAYEFLQGESLAQRLVAGPLPLAQTFSIIRGVGSALAAAHRAGIVHRDLKPQNIFLVQSEVAGHAIELAKVLDFGISKLRGSQTVKTQDSALLGTPQYMAPEQAMGQHSSVDERSDIFALGAIVYEMVSGKAAFAGASIPEVVFKVVYEQPAPLDASVPPAVASAITTAMAKAPADRFANVGEFVEALTGMPLPLRTTVPPQIPSGDQRKITANEAFAQTMGSGDHGESPAAGHLGPTISASAPPPPTRASDERHAPAVPAGIVTSAPTQTGAKRSPALLIALALGGAAIAAVVVFVVMRPSHEPKREHHDRVEIALEHPTTPPPPKPTPAVVPPVIDAGIIAEVDAALPVQRVHPPKAAVAGAVVADTPGDAATEEKLQQAEAAYMAKNLERSEQLANVVVNSEGASRGQRAHAHTLHGIAECVVHHSEEGARIDLRQLDGFTALRHRLLGACRDAGYLTTESD